MGGLTGGKKPPPPPAPVQMPVTPIVDRTIIDREAADMARRRKGRAATILAGDTGPSMPEGSVATKTLLGM